MLTLVQAGGPVALSDVGRQWGQLLIDPQMPTMRRIRDEDAMLRVCTHQPEWAGVFLGGFLSHLVRTLPASDPWRHLSATIEATPDAMKRGPRPPRRNGAVLGDGRAFGGPDHPAFTGSDPEMDVEFGALSDRLAPDAAALLAFSADGWEVARQALELIQQAAITDAANAEATDHGVSASPARIAARAAEHTWSVAESAIRWAVHRRRLIHASRPLTPEASNSPVVAHGGGDELPRDLCWFYASQTDDLFEHPNGTSDLTRRAEAEVAATTLEEPVFWPSD